MRLMRPAPTALTCLLRVIHDRVEPVPSPAMSATPLKAEVHSEH